MYMIFFLTILFNFVEFYHDMMDSLISKTQNSNLAIMNYFTVLQKHIEHQFKDSFRLSWCSYKQLFDDNTCQIARHSFHFSRI